MEEEPEIIDDEFDSEDNLDIPIPEPVVIPEDEKDCIITEVLDEESEALLTPEERIKRRSALQPDISWLKDAIVDNNFVPRKEDYIVVEMYSIVDDRHPWIDTRAYRITREPGEDGLLKLYDPCRQQCAMMNWKTGIEAGYIFKLPPAGRNPETLFESASGRKKKFEKPAYVLKLEKAENKVFSQADQPPPNTEKPKGRGRPPGAKNRSKEEIRLEKEERRKHLTEKRLKRAAKRR